MLKYNEIFVDDDFISPIENSQKYNEVNTLQKRKSNKKKKLITPKNINKEPKNCTLIKKIKEIKKFKGKKIINWNKE